MSKPLTCVKDKTGETQLQTSEYAPDGPVKLAQTSPDERKMINRSDSTVRVDADGKPLAAERPVYTNTGRADLIKRIEVLEAQVKSLQMVRAGVK